MLSQPPPDAVDAEEHFRPRPPERPMSPHHNVRRPRHARREPDFVCPLILQPLGLMHNSYLYAGCDVSADWLDVARGLGPHLLDDGAPERRRFPNDAAGHADLCRWLRDGGRPVRIAVEASGVYSLDLTLALHEADAVEVTLVNPRAAKDYRRSRMHRSPTAVG